MLVLTRKTGEKVVVGKDVVITVVSVGHNKVKIGFDAPKHVNVARSELVPKTNALSLGGGGADQR